MFNGYLERFLRAGERDGRLTIIRLGIIGFSIPPECGPGSSVGIATDHGLDGPGSNPRGDEIFRPSRPALGPTQPPVKWVTGLSRGQIAVGACC